MFATSLILFVFSFSMFSSSCSAQDAPDIVLHNGKIVTVDDEFRIVTAMAIRGDRILAVGSNKDLLNSANAQTEIIDLHGKTVLPGLMDSHTHASGAAVYEFDHEVPVMNNIADVLAYIRGRAELLEDGETIFTSQVFITRLEEQRFPTRAELDSAAPSNPVYFRTGPDMSLNSMGIKTQRHR